jgi:hypothetical protein
MVGFTEEQDGFTEEQGITAIIKLQGFANVEEGREKAKAGWIAMTDREKVSTEMAFYAVFPEEKGK